MTGTVKIQAGILLKFWRFEMTNETIKPTVPDMLRMTGANTAQFMEQVASHVEQLEMEIARLQERVQEIQGAQNGSK